MNATLWTLGLAACLGSPLYLAIAPATAQDDPAVEDAWTAAIEAELEAAMEALERDMESYEIDMEAYERDMEAYELDMEAYELDMEAYELDMEAYERDMEAFHLDGEACEGERASCDPRPEACGEHGVSFRLPDAHGTLGITDLEALLDRIPRQPQLQAALERVAASQGEIARLADSAEVQAAVERALAEARVSGALSQRELQKVLAKAERAQEKACKEACKAKAKADVALRVGNELVSVRGLAALQQGDAPVLPRSKSKGKKVVLLGQDGQSQVELEGEGPHVVWIDDDGTVRVQRAAFGGDAGSKAFRTWTGTFRGDGDGSEKDQAERKRKTSLFRAWASGEDGESSPQPSFAPTPRGQGGGPGFWASGEGGRGFTAFAPAPPAPPAAPPARSRTGEAELEEVVDLLREVQAELRELRASVRELRDDVRGTHAR